MFLWALLAAAAVAFFLHVRIRTLGKTMSVRLGVEIMSISTSDVSSPTPRLLHGWPTSSSFLFTRYGTHLPSIHGMHGTRLNDSANDDDGWRSKKLINGMHADAVHQSKS